MANLSFVICRHIRAYPTTISRCYRQQRRWAKVHDVRFVATQQIQKNITDRYRHLLEKKAQSEGLNNIDELKEVYKNETKRARRDTGSLLKVAQLGQTRKVTGVQNTPDTLTVPLDNGRRSPQTSIPVPSTQPTEKPQTPGVKTLSSFLDLEKASRLSVEEIQSMWRLRHSANKQSLCAATPTSNFTAIYETARKYPRFILPGLPPESVDEASSAAIQNAEGAPIHFMQWTFPSPDTVTVLFTHLAEYKLRGEYSQPHTTLTHHLEMADSKGLVLCQGHVIPDRGVSLEEGRWLVLCMQKFYNTQTIDAIEADPNVGIGKDLRRKRRQLVEQFNQGDANFKFEDLLDQADRLG